MTKKAVRWIIKNKMENEKLENLRTWVEVDTGALRYNLEQARRVIGPKTKLMAVVKSNAYGHGLVGAARIATKNGADWLGVDSVDEGIGLRKVGIKTPILILGYTPTSRLDNVWRFNLQTLVYNKETILELAMLVKKYRNVAKVHLKIETGTSRQGIAIKDLCSFIKLFEKYPRIRVEGIYTHFADTEDLKSTYYKKQLAVFKKAVMLFEGAGYRNLIKHAASSAAIWLYPETHLDMVRLGISYYGLWPSEGVKRIGTKKGILLKPALSWKTRIAQIKYLKKGAYIGYDRTERLKKDSCVAVLPVGYWDGYNRRLSRIGEVIIKGKKCSILGRICMNMIMVNITGLKNVKVEEPVLLLGKSGKNEITAEELAQEIGTINYEVITRINPLILRLYV